jgi:uncharacterized protein YjbI with pentapeptide repeats
MHGDNSDKAAFERVRLVHKIDREWKYLCMFPRIRAMLAAEARRKDRNADIKWANLSWADLSRANLSRANLSRANLSWAYRPISPPDGWTPDANGRLVKGPTP